jgi:DNA-directed RNA polymerase specialized sigma24 family protein
MKINLIYMTDAQLFLNHINDHYQELKWKYYRFCQEKHYDWDEDIFSDTILKCYETIDKKGKMQSNTPYGIESYFFLAFKNNIRNEKRYCRSKCRDWNITSDNINDLYEEYYNKSNDSAKVKIQNDLFKDYATLYIMLKVEEHFDAEHFYLFKIKTLTKGMTFKKLQETCKHIKSTRKKFIEVQQWLKDNVTKEDVRKAFYEEFGDLME